MLTWQDATRDPQPVMPYLKSRFREMSAQDLVKAADKSRFARDMAARHDLTPREALDEVDDALMLATRRGSGH